MIAARAKDFASWRDEARRLVVAGVAPADVTWDDGVQAGLFGDAAPAGEARAPRVPPEFLERAEIACCHAAPDRFAVLYRLLWKLARGPDGAGVLRDPLDPDAVRLAGMLRDVREEEHRMHAFVRFRRTTTADGGERWIAWFQPAHDVLARVAPFFARRYPAMRWTIFTPDASADWDGETLRFGPGTPDGAPPPDELDALFLTYYASVFNPARTNAAVLARHVPARIRTQLPEGDVMGELARGSTARVARLAPSSLSACASFMPPARDLPSLAAAANACRACPIGERATQSVFGEGPAGARLMIVGEQPGDEEDQRGRPFVGPAGRVLDDLLAAAKIPRGEVYVTNAVKHFKWEGTFPPLRGKRRLHSRPIYQEVEACRGWLDAEIAAVKPAMILCLGATAGQSFAGKGFRIRRDRGRPSTTTPWAPWWMATYHPSALLRAPDEGARRAMEAEMRADLELTAAALARLARPQ